MKLTVDPNRKDMGEPFTGIYVRALNGDKWESVDLAQLDRDSLLIFLRSRGGENPWAEDVVGILLGHGHLHARPSPLKD